MNQWGPPESRQPDLSIIGCRDDDRENLNQQYMNRMRPRANILTGAGIISISPPARSADIPVHSGVQGLTAPGQQSDRTSISGLLRTEMSALRKGFTLIELLVVIAIIAILAAML